MSRDQARRYVESMRLWVAVAAALALVSGGCSETLPLHGDVAFSAEERAQIELGNTWIANRIDREPFAIVWDLPHGSPANGTRIVRDDEAKPWDWGVADITISPRHPAQVEDEAATRIRLALVGVVAAHEFGHVHGLQHHEGPGLMNPHPSAMVWTDADQAQCVKDGVCHGETPL